VDSLGLKNWMIKLKFINLPGCYSFAVMLKCWTYKVHNVHYSFAGMTLSNLETAEWNKVSERR
jgi:hypothetical protein